MKAVVIRCPGGPEVLELREVDEPPCGPDDLLVEVRATALNRADLLQRRGLYPAPPGAPADVPGLEFAGEVCRLGARVRGFRRGDRVMGLTGGGAYAEFLSVDHRLCMRVPPALDFEQAAAIPEAFLTAFHALFVLGRLAAGEALLVHAAGSGVGTAAVQLAGVAGARVVALSRSESKRRALLGMGVTGALAADQPELTRHVQTLCGGPVHLVLELLGAATLPFDLDVLARGGRIVLVGLMAGRRVELDLSVLLLRHLTLTGTTLRSRPLDEKIDLVRSFSSRMLPLFAAGKLRPVIDRTLRLDEAPEAHSVMERNENFGKLVLRVPA